MNKLATIGYETDTQAGMIARLKAAEVELVAHSPLRRYCQCPGCRT